MNKSKMRKTGTMLVLMLLFVLTGCVNKDLPKRIVITGLNIFADSNPIENNYVWLNKTGTTAAALSATAVGDDSADISWSVMWGDDFVSLSANSGNTVAVTAKDIGTAKIRVTASNSSNSLRKDFNVVVNPEDRNWTFGIFDGTDGSTEINEVFAISPGGVKPVVLITAAATGTVSAAYVWSCNNPAFNLSQTTGESSVITAPSTMGSSADITITATVAGIQVTKTFLASVAIEIEEGVLFKWNCSVLPMTPLSAGVPVSSGYNGINFRAGGMSIPVTSEGAFDLGGTSDRRLYIGSTSDSATSDTSHTPGVFNLSRGTYKLTIDYREPARGTSGTSDAYVLRVIFNNNQPGQALSPLNTRSVLIWYDTVAQLETGTGLGANAAVITQTAGTNRMTLTFSTPDAFAGAPNGTDSLSTAFFGFACQGTSSIIITGIRLEELK